MQIKKLCQLCIKSQKSWIMQKKSICMFWPSLMIKVKGGPSYPFVDRRGREFPTGFTKLY